MNTVTISKSTWGFSFYKIGLHAATEEPNFSSVDICTYRKYVCIGVLATILILSVVAAIGILLTMPFIELFFQMMYHENIIPVNLFAISLFTWVWFLIVLIGSGISRYLEYKRNRYSISDAPLPKPKKSSGMSEMIKSFKNKYCYKVTFED